MKKVLILVVSSVEHPYLKMIDTSLNTWDKVEVEGVETIFYSGIPYVEKEKLIQFPYKESYSTMGYKMLDAFEFALEHYSFDYIARVNSSCYVDKKKLIEYCNNLEEENVFSCIEVASEPIWAWGGGQFILSKDVVQKVLVNKDKYNHNVMEDVALSRLVDEIGVPYHKGKCCSINEATDGWVLMGYGGDSIEFKNFNEVKKLNNHFYRVKIDRDRSIDEYLMNQLYSVLK
jgi:hypothetical protein